MADLRDFPEATATTDSEPSHDSALGDLPAKGRRIVALRLQALDLWRECVAARPPGTTETNATRRFIAFWNAVGFSIRVSQSRLYAWRSNLQLLGVRGLIDGHYLARSPAPPKKIPDPFWSAFVLIYVSGPRCSINDAWTRALDRCPAERRAEWAEQFRPYRFAAKLKGLTPLIEAARRRNRIRDCELN